VTEQVRLADELAEERDFASSLIETAPVIILLLDSEGRIQHANPYFEDLVGYRLEEIRGKDWFSTFLPERDQKRIRTGFESATGDVRARAEVHPILTRRGEERDIEWYDQVMRDGQGRRRYLLAVGQDITERRRSLEALAASQRTLREILDNMFAYVALIAADGEVLELNQAPLAAAKLERKDVVGHNVWRTPIVAGQDTSTVFETFQAALAGAPIRRDLPIRFGRSRIMTLDTCFAPIRDESGKVARVVSFGVDVSEQRAMEQQSRRLEAQLQKQQRLQALGTLAGGIAHDFNNLLMVILGNVDAARIHVSEGAVVSEDLDGIDRAGQRAQELVQQILAFSRRQEHVLDKVPIVPLLEDALKLLRSTLPARFDLKLTATDPDAQILADSSQIHQVVMNLVTNAWHAMGDRPGRIELDVHSEWLKALPGEPADLAAGPYVRVDVRDTGNGMDPEVLERAFEPFFTTKPPGQGSGLGLSVVHGIMKSHNGAVVLESEPGKGTLARLYFPAAEASGMPSELASSGGTLAASAQGEHILFVDDEPAIVGLAERLLRTMGYRVSCHSSPTQALAAFAEHPEDYALVITDYSMPAMSGVELARAVLKIRPGLPILAMSGFLTPDEVRRTVDAGIARVMMKPVSFRRLGAAVSDLLRPVAG
jgi:PAS domain S-box-containing protein